MSAVSHLFSAMCTSNLSHCHLALPLKNVSKKIPFKISIISNKRTQNGHVNNLWPHQRQSFRRLPIDGSILPPSVSSSGVPERGIARSPSSSSITAGRAGNTQSTEIRQEPLEPTKIRRVFFLDGKIHRKSMGFFWVGFCLGMGVAPLGPRIPVIHRLILRNMNMLLSQELARGASPKHGFTIFLGMDPSSSRMT